MLNRFWGLFSSDLAIDLGTANTLVYTRGRGVIINEPSVVAFKRDNSGSPKIVSIGHEAKAMLGKTPHSIAAVTPMKDGVIADFEATELMLRYFIQRAHNRATLVRPRIVICVPYGVTDVERRAVKESAQSSGAREIFLVEEPMAAGIGAGLPIMEPSGNMVVDIGGGTTEVAVIALGGIVYSRSVRVAGNKMDDAIINYIKRKYSLLIGEGTAEHIKMTIGTAVNDEEQKVLAVKGQDMINGIPKTVDLNSHEIYDALQDPLQSIVEAVRFVLERTPPELSSDISERGIVLTGGGALLHGIDRLLAQDTALPVRIAEDPVKCVVMGCGKILESRSMLQQLTSI